MYKVYSALLVSLTALAGCIQTRAYSGPERPKSEVSTVYFYAARPLEISSMRVDGTRQGLFDTGIDVLPGAHSTDFNYQYVVEDCDGYGCMKTVYEGSCQGQFDTEPGKEYRIDVSGVMESAGLSISEADSKRPVGSGQCSHLDTTFGFRTRHSY